MLLGTMQCQLIRVNAFATKTTLGAACQAQKTELCSAASYIRQASIVQPALFAVTSCLKPGSAQALSLSDIVA